MSSTFPNELNDHLAKPTVLQVRFVKYMIQSLNTYPIFISVIYEEHPENCSEEEFVAQTIKTLHFSGFIKNLDMELFLSQYQWRSETMKNMDVQKHFLDLFDFTYLPDKFQSIKVNSISNLFVCNAGLTFCTLANTNKGRVALLFDPYW